MEKPKQKIEPEYVKKEKSINYSVTDGFFTSIKAGFTESFVMPFAIALNASTGMLAALASVPQLVASFFQLFAQESLRFFKTRSRLIVWTAAIQSLMWLPLLLVPFIAKSNIWLLLLFVTLEATLGTFQGPIYNSILGDIVSEDKRGEFFGRKNRIVNLMNFVSTFIAGFILSYFKGMDTNNAYYVFFGFAILFFIAFVSRAIAAYYKSKIYAPVFIPTKKHPSFFRFVKNMSHNNYGIFVSYVFLFKFAASISAPFFALFLLRDLSMGYMYFTLIMGASIIASFLSMNFWGKQIDKHGSKRVLTIAGFLVPLSPLLIILAIYIKSPLYVFIFLFLEEAFSGIVWAAFNLSTSSFLFDATSKEERIKYMAYYNFLCGIAIFLGAIFGGFLINIFPIWIFSAIPFIFLTTGILRMVSTIIMIKKVSEARMVEIDFPGRGFFFHRTVEIVPHQGAVFEVMGTYENRKLKPRQEIIQKEKRKPIDPVKKEERSLYEKKELEYYRENAMKTMAQKKKDITQKDDSDKIEKDIEQDTKKISEITDRIKKENLKK